jgi:hypothetical protein
MALESEYRPEGDYPAEAARERLRSITKEVLRALEAPRERWIPRLYRVLHKQRAAVAALPPEDRRMLEREIDLVLDVIRQWRDSSRPDGDFYSHGQDFVHRIEEVLEVPEEAEREPVELRKMSLEELAAKDPRRIRVDHSEDGIRLSYRFSTDGPWSETLVPATKDLFYKGGLPRILLKIALGITGPTLAAEFPVNDIDVITKREKNMPRAIAEARRLGVDPDGIEFIDSTDDMETVMRTRDVDINQSLLGVDGLIYTAQAENAMRNGVLRSVAECRGLYGSGTYYYQGVKLDKNRTTHRLFKFVVENKIESFAQARLNRQLDMGIYWLVLARKFGMKPNAGTLLNRLYEVGRRAGQVRDGEKDIFDVLRRVHDQFPFYHFSQQNLDETNTLRWLARKLGNMADRRFRLMHGIRSNLVLERRPGDDVSERISLDGYRSDARKDSETANQWKSFLRERDAVYVKNASDARRD